METMNNHDQTLATNTTTATKTTTSHNDHQQQPQSRPASPPVVYGELSVLGYNGSIPHSDKSSSSSSGASRRNKSKYLLCKRPEPNGIKKSRHYIVKQQPQTTKAIQDKDLHSISYTFSRSQTIIVEYRQDERTDMFQIGRSSESPIDFIVTDTVTANSDARGNNHHHHHHHSHNYHSSSKHHNYDHNENSTTSDNGLAYYQSQIYLASVAGVRPDMASMQAYQRNLAKMRQNGDSSITSVDQSSNQNGDMTTRYQQMRENQAHALPPVLLNSYALPPSNNAPSNLSAFMMPGYHYNRDNRGPIISSSGLNNVPSIHNIPNQHNHHHVQPHTSTSMTSNSNNYYQAQLQPRPENNNNEHHLNPNNNHNNSNNIMTSSDQSHHQSSNRQSSNCKRSHATQSTISRFACRILVDRYPPYTARIYAAGFDSSKNIFLGEKATKWEQDDSIDGLTTNGVLLMHPKEEFTPPSQDSSAMREKLKKEIDTKNEELAADLKSASEDQNKQDCSINHEQKVSNADTTKGDNSTMVEMETSPDQESGDNTSHYEEASECTPNEDRNNNTKQKVDVMKPPNAPATGGVWREVSVDGGIYAIRESRSAAQKGKRIEYENNILKDGTLIDLCGATLLWRSLEGFKSAPTKKSLEEKVDKLNASRPQCPVGLNTLVIPRKAILSLNQHNHHHHHSKSSHHPYVYTKCGHVQGYHDWGATDKLNTRTCPICMTVGNVARLTIGIEPSFYVDSGQLTHSFNPCGHMATERTAKYWSSIKIPYGTHFFHSICPFCATPLSTSELPVTKLIFQLDIE